MLLINSLQPQDAVFDVTCHTTATSQPLQTYLPNVAILFVSGC